MARLGKNPPKVFKHPDTGVLQRKEEVELTPTPGQIHESIQAAEEIVEEAAPVEWTSAAAYTQDVKRRQALLENAKSVKRPVGGAPPLEKAKMEHLAAHLGRVQGIVAPQFPPVPGTAERGDLPPPPPPPQLPRHQLPTKEDVKTVKGVGASLEYNQAMARGEIDKPMSLAEARRMEERPEMPEVRIRPTGRAKELLNEMTHQQAPQPQAPPVQAQPQAPPPSPPLTTQLDDKESELEKAEEEIVQRQPEDLLSVQWQQLNEVQKILMDPERKKTIEANLESLDIADLVLAREITQLIPIVPNKFTITLRTIQEYENMFCLRKMYGVIGSTEYVLELLTAYKMTCALVAINGSPLPDHRTSAGQAMEEVNETAFDHKLSIILGQATPVIAEIGVQYDWFVLRVNQLLSVDAIKNG